VTGGRIIRSVQQNRKLGERGSNRSFGVVPTPVGMATGGRHRRRDTSTSRLRSTSKSRTGVSAPHERCFSRRSGPIRPGCWTAEGGCLHVSRSVPQILRKLKSKSFSYGASISSILPSRVRWRIITLPLGSRKTKTSRSRKWASLMASSRVMGCMETASSERTR